MPAVAWWIIGGVGLLWVSSQAARETGEAVDTTGNGALKIAAAAALGVWAYNQVRK